MVAYYIAQLNKEYKTGSATEHTYRGHLKELIESLDENVIAINEPKRVKAGAPDYLIASKEDHIEIGHIEAKDIGKDLHSKLYKEQFTRYKKGLENLIITDYMEFDFYKDGEHYANIRIAEEMLGEIRPIEENFDTFMRLIKDFTTYVGQTITSSSRLAEMMAAKAKLMADVMHKALNIDLENDEHTEIVGQYQTFKEVLIDDMSPKDFADMYAQTITYGMFTARFHDETLPTFSREEAATLVPHSNPFLRKLFQQLAGYDLDTRIAWMVDSLVKIFKSTDVRKLLENFGKTTQRNDPIIHFYEEFLASFDPKLRKARGVWYTPEPVVKFIIRAVDNVLKSEFGLEDGLSDTTKTTITVEDKDAGFTKAGKVRTKVLEVHKVQVLDPATGTGTFLAEIINHVKNEFFGGGWSKYVEEDLIPRLHGFEIVMASYAMAHLKLDLLLKLTGYTPQSQQRLKVYLTNSLEEHHESTGTLFASFLAEESQQADRVKKEAPVMVVVGNPPYAVSSSNKGEWIQELIKDYKKDLNERNIQPLSDDYIKFIRYGQHYIDKNGEGILAYISNNSFIDGIIHRQMRKNLLETFDKIYILDLHGNSKKKETSPDGSKDENVFDIMQGVSINIFIKKKEVSSKKLADVYHADLFGKRKEKYDFLNDNTLDSIKWKNLEYKKPYYFFVYKDFSKEKEYNSGYSVSELFNLNGTGVKFRKDNLLVKNNFSKSDVVTMINDMKNLEKIEILKKYNLKETNDWSVEEQKQYFIEFNEKDIRKVLYRPFDYKFTYYPMDKISKMIPRGDSRRNLMKHFFQDNLGLVTLRLNGEKNEFVSLITNTICEKGSLPRGNYHVFPLYIYSDENTLDQTRSPNLDTKIVKKIAKSLGMQFTDEVEEGKDIFAPIDLLDYIYAVLHSPNYRDKYKEFLKIDFPRVPYPKAENFWQLVALGKELRELHLLESTLLSQRVIEVNDGNNEITRKIVKKDVEIEEDKVKIWLNDEQYISNIPLKAWEFYIGGYQPAQKWLKDRSGRTLSHNDFKHYNKMIVSMVETDRVMKEIDGVLEV